MGGSRSCLALTMFGVYSNTNEKATEVVPEGRKTFGRCAYIHYLDCSDCLKGVKNYQILL